MKKIIVNILYVTGALLVIFAIYLKITGKETISVNNIFEILGASILINVGITLRYRIEIRNFILENIINLSYIIGVLLAFRAVFKWYSLSVWFFILLGFIIYILSIVLLYYQDFKKKEEINKLLKERREKNNETL
jgi:hypothetical protein